jgi:hypothetical protein
MNKRVGQPQDDDEEPEGEKKHGFSGASGVRKKVSFDASRPNQKDKDNSDIEKGQTRETKLNSPINDHLETKQPGAPTKVGAWETPMPMQTEKVTLNNNIMVQGVLKVKSCDSDDDHA